MDKKKNLSQKFKGDKHTVRLVIIMAVWFIFLAITRFSKFYTVVNFQTMFSQFPEFGLMSLGAMVCMITGGIDLSTVGTANMTGITMALVMMRLADANGELNPAWIVLIFVLAILMGIVAGTLNGLLITKAHIPPMLATLGTSQLFTGIGLVMTNGSAISNIPNTYAYSINNKVAGIPVQFIIFAVVAAILAILLNKTTYGKKVYLVGSNQNVARYSGLKVDRLLIKTYIISGVCSALGGLIMLANYNSARSDYGANYTLQCILVVVLGGVSPSGGKGKITGVLLAIFLVRALETGINRFPQISSYYISLIWGAVLLLVMLMNYVSDKNISFKKVKKSEGK